MMFNGFCAESFLFLDALALNNTQDFFAANRGAYLAHVREPMLALGEEFAPIMRAIDANLDTRPQKAIARINRDTRFSKDKSPYRDHLWMTWKPAGQRAMEAPAFFVSIERDGVAFGMGMYAPKPALFRPIRQQMALRPSAFAEVIAPILASQWLELQGESYARPTAEAAGAPPELLPWINMKNFYVMGQIPVDARVFGRDMVDILRQAYQDCTPLYRYFLACLPQGDSV